MKIHVKTNQLHIHTSSRQMHCVLQGTGRTISWLESRTVRLPRAHLQGDRTHCAVNTAPQQHWVERW